MAKLTLILSLVAALALVFILPTESVDEKSATTDSCASSVCPEGGWPCVKVNQELTVREFAELISGVEGLDTKTFIAVNGWAQCLTETIAGDRWYEYKLPDDSVSKR